MEGWKYTYQQNNDCVLTLNFRVKMGMFQNISLVAAVLELYFCCGMIFGWANLVKIFKNEGFFSKGCVQDISLEVDYEYERNISDYVEPEKVKCVQDEALTKVFVSASTLFSIAALATGIIYDKFGTSVTRMIGNGLFLAGITALILATPGESDK